MKTRIGLVVSVALALVSLLALVTFTTPGEAAPVLQQSDHTCFVEITGDNATDHSSADASALQDALDALDPTSDTVKVAGTCAGVQNVGGYTQTLHITRSNVTIQGGYTPTAWLADPDPVAYPTVLDARGAGRVVLTPRGTHVQNVTLDGFFITNGDARDIAGSCYHTTPNGGGGLCLSIVTDFVIRNSTIYSNTAEKGGGLYHHGGGDVLLVNTSVISNVASLSGGGLYQSYNGIELRNCTISGNTSGDSGGGIYIFRDRLTSRNSTLSGNSASNGGGMYLESAGTDVRATIINSTIVSNTATLDGGGLYRQSTPTTLTNTLVAYNSDNNGSSPDCYGEIVSGDYNLIQDDTGCSLTGTMTHVITGTDPLLGPLADNGGPSTGSGRATWTHALLTGSPALNWIPAGSNGCGTSVTEDQRGVTRPQGSACDIGAYELAYACFAEITGDSVTDFASQDAGAVQAALDALDLTSDTVKLAGTCAGVGSRAGLMQTAYVSQSVTLQGGYTHTHWLDTPDPAIHTTRLDAESRGRVVYVSGVDATLDGLYLTGGDGAGDDGGAVFVDGGALIVLDSTFTGNQSALSGGALAAWTGALTVTDSTFTGNTASWYGGAIYSEDVITVTGSTFSDNRAEDGGAMEADGGGWIDRCTFSGNRSTNGMGGGALYVYTSTLFVSDSTFAENWATEGSGGAINNAGELSVLNSTFYSNTATSNTSGWAEGWGGAIVNYGTLIVTHSTFVSNTATYSGTTLYTYEGDGETGSGTSYLYNTLLAGETSGILHCEGGLSANLNNLIEDGSCSPALSGDPRVGALGDNDGQTQTVALLPDSPAIDAGDATMCASGDQRGYARDDWACDIGAFEMQLTDGDSVSKTVATGGIYTFGPTLVKVGVMDDGGCLTGLAAQRIETDHPNATAGIQTGRYWTLTPVGCAEGFTATLTLPLDRATSAGDKVCRWDATSAQWDCGDETVNSSADSGPVAMPDIVTRASITKWSDWAVGSQVGPTSLALSNPSATSNERWLALLGMTAVALVLAQRRARRSRFDSES